MAIILIGLCAGLLSGLLGVGGGTITIPALVFFTGATQHLAQGVSLAVIIPTAIVGAYGYFVKKKVNIETAVLLASGAVIGSVAGSMFANLISQKNLKIFFGIFMIIIGVKIIKDVLSK